jgi:hypothetical protein
VKLRSKDLAKPDTGCSCLSTAEGATDIKYAEFASGDGHAESWSESYPGP